jgi:hypothetical protein
MSIIGKISLINLKGKRGIRIENLVYIGRRFGGYEGSVLGNRFKSGRDGNRDEVVDVLYRDWLWKEYQKKGVVYDELVRLVNKLKKGEDVVLGCWCYPLNCHGNIVMKCVEWMLKK